MLVLGEIKLLGIAVINGHASILCCIIHHVYKWHFIQDKYQNVFCHLEFSRESLTRGNGCVCIGLITAVIDSR